VEDPTTQELRIEQLQRELEEKKSADDAEAEADTAQHERRASKAEYLREKLDQRAEAEREAAKDDNGA
jgi:hypothetical protein